MAQPPPVRVLGAFLVGESPRGTLSRVLLPRRDEVAALSTAVGKRQRRLNGLAQGALATSEERTPATATSRPFIAPIGLWRGTGC